MKMLQFAILSQNKNVFLPKSTIKFRSWTTYIRCSLGFDPTTKKLKVLKAYYVSDEKGNYKVRHWIFTLGIDKSWRKIRGWDNFFPDKNICVYVNGVIYFVNVYTLGREIAAFNVGDESFRMIAFPRGVSSSI